jgi:hypothetical protein
MARTMRAELGNAPPLRDFVPYNAQRAGRNTRCLGLGNITPDAAAAEWREAYGGKRVASGSIVSPTIDGLE